MLKLWSVEFTVKLKDSNGIDDNDIDKMLDAAELDDELQEALDTVMERLKALYPNCIVEQED